MVESAEEGKGLGKTLFMIFIFVAVIGIVVAIVTALISRTNGATDDMMAALNSAETAKYAKYDGTVVSGSEVTGVTSTYRGQEFVIAVHTIGSANNPGAFDVTATPTDQVCDVYNAIPTGATAGNPYTATINYDAATGIYSIDSLDFTSGQTLINTNFAPLTNRSLATNFVKQNGKFQSNLIIDKSTESIVGVIFQQIN